VFEPAEAAELRGMSMSLWSDPFLETFFALGFLGAEGAADFVAAVVFFVLLVDPAAVAVFVSASVPSSID
jgi:uncharacterized membrane protein YtjA (UPF0391 family)